MTRLVHLGMALGLIIGFTLASEATAQCNPSNYPDILQDIPEFVKLVAKDDFGVPDPIGAYTITIHPQVGFLVDHVPVAIDFSECPDIRICQTQEPGTTVTCSGRAVMRYTNTNGKVTFTIVGKANNFGCASGDPFKHAKVFVCGNFCRYIFAAAYDQDPSDGVNPLDVSKVYADCNCNCHGDPQVCDYIARSDFNGDRKTNALDVSAVYGVAVGGKSKHSCISNNYCP